MRLQRTANTSEVGVDASAVMRAFARRCALDVAHLWDMPPLVRSYLETGEESIMDAAGAAAAWAAAWDAAWRPRGAAAWAAAIGTPRGMPRCREGLPRGCRVGCRVGCRDAAGAAAVGCVGPMDSFETRTGLAQNAF